TQHAAVLSYHFRPVEGEKYARRAVAAAQRIGSGHSIYLAFAMSALTMCVEAQERWEEALQLSQECAQLYKQIEGESHADYRGKANRVIGLLAILRRCEEGMAQVSELSASKSAQPEAFVVTTRALILIHCGKSAEAEALTREEARASPTSRYMRISLAIAL